MSDTMKKAGAHAVLVSSSGKIVLVAKGMEYAYFKNNAGKVSMFGGGMEAGEEPLAALKRELREELGLDISANEVSALNTYQKTEEQDGGDASIHVFMVKGIDSAALKIQKESADVATKDANERIIEGTADELLTRPDLTRITRLALEDFVKNPNPQA
jgi:8-oxo-dGTP pyrophosphatase MutT (NUDIX family)